MTEEGGPPLATNDVEGESPRPGTQQPQQEVSPSRWRKRLIEVGAVVLTMAAAALLRVYVYESDIVQGSSMAPALRSGDYVLVSKVAYARKPLERFDVITFRAPGQKEVAIKRVVGLPGEWVWVVGNRVFVGGSRLEEPYAAEWRGGLSAPVWVPEESIFVLGDNRDASEDSRTWGPVPLSSVRGKAVLVYFPLNQVRLVR